jgi:hypothetical protein
VGILCSCLQFLSTRVDLVHMGDDIKDNKSKSEILLGTISVWLSSIFIIAILSIISTFSLPSHTNDCGIYRYI